MRSWCDGLRMFRNFDVEVEITLELKLDPFRSMQVHLPFARSGGNNLIRKCWKSGVGVVILPSRGIRGIL